MDDVVREIGAQGAHGEGRTVAPEAAPVPLFPWDRREGDRHGGGAGLQLLRYAVRIRFRVRALQCFPVLVPVREAG